MSGTFQTMPCSPVGLVAVTRRSFSMPLLTVCRLPHDATIFFMMALSRTCRAVAAARQGYVTRNAVFGEISGELEPDASRFRLPGGGWEAAHMAQPEKPRSLRRHFDYLPAGSQFDRPLLTTAGHGL